MGIIKDELSSIFKVGSDKVSYRDTIQLVLIGIGNRLLMATIWAKI